MATEVVYDTEFIDNGVTIEPISIAMVEGDRELYAISDSLATMSRAAENHWLRENVLPWLPLAVEWLSDSKIHVRWDTQHPDYDKVKPLNEIAEMVEDFITFRSDTQLWAYYGAYDHVLLAQLYGPMVELPTGVPMLTNDIKQEAIRLGNPKLPKLRESLVKKRFGGTRMEHNALYDTYEERYRLHWLRNYERSMFRTA
jgi:hypothetical protein